MAGKQKGEPKPPMYRHCSLPTEFMDSLEEFTQEIGRPLGLNSMPQVIMAAVRDYYVKYNWQPGQESTRHLFRPFGDKQG